MQPAPIQVVPRPQSEEVAWTDYVESVIRRWRFVVIGTVGCWAVIGLAALLVPRTYLCSAALSLPPVVQPLKKEEAQKPGIPIALYKLMERMISDEAVLAQGMGRILAAGEIRDLIRNLGEYVSPITSNPRDDFQRIDREDTITGIQLNYTTHPEDRARQVVSALGDLVHDAFVTSYAVDQVLSQMVKASHDEVEAVEERMKLTQESLSLDKEAADMARLTAEARGPAPAGGREVVDTKDGGHLFLPPALQLVGIRAKQAENSHKIRMLERDAEVARLRIGFLRQLDGRLAKEAREHGSPVLRDIPRMIREELATFVSGPAAGSPSAPSLKITGDGLAETIGSLSGSARFVQTPTLKRKPRALALSAAAVAAIVLFVAAALVAESWRQYHERG